MIIIKSTENLNVIICYVNVEQYLFLISLQNHFSKIFTQEGIVQKIGFNLKENIKFKIIQTILIP